MKDFVTHSSGLPEGCLPFRFPGVPGVECLFTSALAGNFSFERADDEAERAAVVERRSRLRAALGCACWTELRQVHGTSLLADPEPTAENLPGVVEADGHCTQRQGHALIIKTADCQPILLAHKGGGHVAAMHAGWRGNALHFPEIGVRVFCETYGLQPRDVLAVRGPSLGPGAAEFINFDREWPREFAAWFDSERRTMDLWELTKAQLVRAGLSAGNIFSLDMCTHSLPSFFFSHRRGHQGRQLSVIQIR